MQARLVDESKNKRERAYAALKKTPQNGPTSNLAKRKRRTQGKKTRCLAKSSKDQMVNEDPGGVHSWVEQSSKKSEISGSKKQERPVD